MSRPKDYYESVLQEDLREQFKFIVEALHAMRNVPSDVAQLKADVKDLKSDMVAVKLAWKDISKLVNDHEKRITRLEAS